MTAVPTGATTSATTDAATAHPGRGPSSPRSARRRAQHRAAYLFISPWVVGMVVFTAGPMVASLVLSFLEYDLIGEPEVVGLDNYRQAVQDPRVATSLWNTVLYTALHVPLSLALAMALALLLVRLGRSAGLFRTLVYLPVMTPPVAIGAMFLLLLNGQTGLVNDALALVGVDGPGWTTDPAWIKPGIVLMSLWTVGSTAIIYVAALRDVPRELYEAAMLDGAGAWRRFRSVTLPMVSGTIYFTVVVNTIASLQIFAEVYTMYFGSSAAQNASGDAALFYVIYLFHQAFQFLHMGYASALAWLLFLVIVAITAVQVRLARSRVYYEGER
ncbi:carbohydrate ABC transporter permease [Thalassiella azotivora]